VRVEVCWGYGEGAGGEGLVPDGVAELGREGGEGWFGGSCGCGCGRRGRV